MGTGDSLTVYQNGNYRTKIERENPTKRLIAKEHVVTDEMKALRFLWRFTNCQIVPYNLRLFGLDHIVF